MVGNVIGYFCFISNVVRVAYTRCLGITSAKHRAAIRPVADEGRISIDRINIFSNLVFLYRFVFVKNTVYTRRASFVKTVHFFRVITSKNPMITIIHHIYIYIHHMSTYIYRPVIRIIFHRAVFKT